MIFSIIFSLILFCKVLTKARFLHDDSKVVHFKPKTALKTPNAVKIVPVTVRILAACIVALLLDSKIVIFIDKALVQYEKSTFYTFLPRLFEIQIPNAHKKSAENLASPEGIEGIVVANFP